MTPNKNNNEAKQTMGEAVDLQQQSVAAEAPADDGPNVDHSLLHKGTTADFTETSDGDMDDPGSPPLVTPATTTPATVGPAFTSPPHGAIRKDKGKKEKPATSGVTFGDVHIHKHRMTMGTNPSVKVGVPVELDWEKTSSELLSVDHYEDTHHQFELRRLNRLERQDIALVNHSRDSVIRRQQEVFEAQRLMDESARDSTDEDFNLGRMIPSKKKPTNSCCVIT